MEMHKKLKYTYNTEFAYKNSTCYKQQDTGFYRQIFLTTPKVHIKVIIDMYVIFQFILFAQGILAVQAYYPFIAPSKAANGSGGRLVLNSSTVEPPKPPPAFTYKFYDVHRFPSVYFYLVYF